MIGGAPVFLRLLGTFALTDGKDEDLLPRTRKTRAVLAYLILANGRAVPRSELIALAWRDRGEEQARASLRQALYEARGLVARELLMADRDQVRIDPRLIESDIDRIAAAVRAEDAEEVARQIGPSLAPLLIDLDGIDPAIDAWLTTVRETQRHTLKDMLAALVATSVEQGERTHVTGLANLLAAEFPDDESIARLASSARADGSVPPPGRAEIKSWRTERTARIAGLAFCLIVLAGVAVFWWWRHTASGSRLIVVAPLYAAPSDQAAQDVRLGLSGDVARAMIGNRAGLSIGQLGDRGVRLSSAQLELTGAVASAGAALRAHVQLANLTTGSILWSRDFLGDRAQPDALREQIATKIGSVLNCALNTRHRGARSIGDDPTRLYLGACDSIGDFDLDTALGLLQQVTALAPDFAQAWADLGTTQAFVASDLPEADRTAPLRVAAANAWHALALDPKTGLAYYALARTMPGIANWARRTAIIAKGLAVEPDGSELNNAMGQQMLMVGRADEGWIYMQRSMDADPLNPVKTATAIPALAFDGGLDDAEDLIARALRIWPHNAFIWSAAFGVQARIGDAAAAAAMLRDPSRPALRGEPRVAFWQAFLAARAHPTPANVDAVVAVLRTGVRGENADSIVLAHDLAAVGRIDLAYQAALAGPPPPDEDSDGLLFRSYMAPFRADPRFMSVAARQGLIAIWRATGHWPDFCKANLAPYDCVAMAAKAERAIQTTTGPGHPAAPHGFDDR